MDARRKTAGTRAEAAPAPAVPSGPRAARKREAILDAARRVFLREGFGAGVDLLAAEAGVSKVTLYNHFGSKERLFMAVIGQTLDEALGESQAVIHERLAEAVDVRAALVQTCRAWVQGLTTPEVLALRDLIAAERRRFPELGRTWLERGPTRQHAAIAAALDRLVARGRLRIADTEVAALQLAGLVLHPHLVLSQYSGGVDPQLVERLIENGVDLFLSGYEAAARVPEARRPD
ncbi:TetR/AcrR family transcriptional regulator [Streptomyces sp. A7024]|uniref:TetR/AcrR family transcriptional regulator n=1 Tax=Streptomyces coryli TaxID=1128680 RepID=A0A6G4TZ20_9ACTN|nr:TetR/AcrR family transcriptional regulator [Streptomyces coryli]NGN64696.1 TetR/AcrR family transcriptional regulator [Streptomyces coryli]